MKRIALLFLLSLPLVAFAQQATVVSSCAAGRATPLNPGTQAPVMVDTAGNLCNNGTSTPSGTQDVNLKQIGGVTTSTGAGATGTGTQRVGVAQDATTVAGSAPGTAGTASANVVTVQGIAGATAIKTDGSATQQPTTDAVGNDSSGTFTNATQTTSVTATLETGQIAYSTVTVTVLGTYGTATGIFEKTDDDTLTNWFPVQCSQEGQGVIETGYSSLTNVSRMWQCNTQGANAFRVRSTAVASGTVNILISPSAMPTINGGTIAVAPSIDTAASGSLTVQDAGSSTTTGQNSASIVTGTATAGSTTSIALNGRPAIGTLLTGTWVGTVQFEGSQDSGTTWTPFGAHVRGAAPSVSTATSNGLFLANTTGLTNYRIRWTARTSGTVSVAFTAASETGVVYVANAIKVLGIDNTSQVTVKAASTAPASTDTSMVVALNPNASNPVNDPGLPDTLGIKTAANSTSFAPASDATFPVTGTFWQATQPISAASALNVSPDNVADGANIAATAASATVLTNTPFATLGYAVVDVNLSAISATSVTPQASFDGGSTYATVRCRVLSSASTVDLVSLTATGVYECPAGDHFQLTQVGAGSTTAKITLKRQPFGIGSPQTWTSGTTNTTAMLQTGGYDGSTARRFVVGTDGSLFVVGSVASASADSGNPVKVGAKYNATSLQLSDANRGDAQIDANGALIVGPNAVRANRWNYAAAASGISNTTTAVTIKTAAASGLRNCITNIQISSDALGAATEFAIRDGASGTVVWRTKIGTAGYINGYNTAMEGAPVCGTAATLLEVVTLTASITGSVYFNAQGYIAP